jgi:hypothetical protein
MTRIPGIIHWLDVLKCRSESLLPRNKAPAYMALAPMFGCMGLADGLKI